MKKLKQKKMKYPEIKFSLNKSLDKKMAIEFLSHNYLGGINFAQRILGPHPGIKKHIFGYIDNFYKQHRPQLLKTAVNFQKLWAKKSKQFFTATDFVFKHQKPCPGQRPVFQNWKTGHFYFDLLKISDNI